MLDNDYDYDNDNEPPRDFCTAPLGSGADNRRLARFGRRRNHQMEPLPSGASNRPVKWVLEYDNAGMARRWWIMQIVADTFSIGILALESSLNCATESNGGARNALKVDIVTQSLKRFC